MRLSFTLWNHAVGGAETHTRALCAELARACHEVQLIVLTPHGPLASQPGPPGVSVSTAAFSSAADAVRRAKRLHTVLSDFGPDCVFTSAYDAALPVLRRAGYRGPVCVVEHGGVILNPRLRPRWRYWTQMTGRRAMSSRVQAEIAVSRFMWTVQTKLPHASQLMVVPNGVDIRRFRPVGDISRVVPPGSAPAATPLRLGAAGTLRRDKGFGLLVAAMARLRLMKYPVKLTIAGDGPDHDKLARMAKSLRLSSSVQLLGRVDDMASFYRDQELVVVPSTSAFVESFNLVAVEAQACGVPVVAAGVGALPEVVAHERTGMVCRPDSSAALADAIAVYARHPHLRADHGLAARRRVEQRYSLSRAADGYARVASVAVSSRRSI